MQAPRNQEKHGEGNSRAILLMQYCLPISFTFAMIGIITWIIRLILLARRLHDVPSASIGISIVAIPVFLILLGVFWYVFLGIVRNREVPPEGTPEERPEPMGGTAG